MTSSMQQIMRSGATLIVVAVAAMAFTATSAMARHQWADYHWETPTTKASLTINVNNCQLQPVSNSDYNYDPTDHFTGPNNDWTDIIDTFGGDIVLAEGACPGSISTNLANPIGTFDHRKTNFIYDAAVSTSEGTVNAFNGNYGGTGWVGVAIVELIPSSGNNHIVYGEVHLNDYYATISNSYNNALVMRKVQCQEIGHIFGVDHVKKDVSCMYSSRAFIGSTYTPNDHDGELVNAITDNHDGGDPPPPDDGGGGGDPCAKKNPPPKCGAAGVFRGKATWVESYASRGEMYEAADLMVRASVLKGSAFDRMVGAAAGVLPVSRAVLQVQESFKGKARGTIIIEQTFGRGLSIEGDPGYIRGEDYVLYLRQIGANTYRIVNPQGRIQQ